MSTDMYIEIGVAHALLCQVAVKTTLLRRRPTRVAVRRVHPLLGVSDGVAGGVARPRPFETA